MKATRQFLPRAISPPPVEEPSASTSPSFTFWPVLTIGRWWMIVPWFERVNLSSLYSSLTELLLTTMRSASTWVTSPSDLARTTSPVSIGGAPLHAGADQRRIRFQQRHRLALHVGAHQGAVGVVVLEERDQRGRHRPDLGRRDVHQVDFLGGSRRVLLLAGADQDLRAFQLAGLGVELGVRLGDHLVLLLGRVVVHDLFADDAVFDQPVRGRDEAVLGHLGIGGERADQADVRSLRGLDRAHPAVMGRVHVADLDRGALTGQAAGAESREPAPVGEPVEAVGLAHELRQLRGAEELLHRRHDRADVDDRLRRDRVRVLGGEALADDALHPVEADPEGLLDQLADRAQAAVAEVLVLVEVLVDGLARIGDRLRGVVFDRVLLVDLLGDPEQFRQQDQLLDEGDDVVVGEDPRLEVDVEIETGVELVAADPGQVVALGVEEELLEQAFGGVD